MCDNHSLLCLGAMFPVSHHWRYFSNSGLTRVTLCSSGKCGPHLAGPHRISKFFEGQNRQEPRLWKHPWGSKCFHHSAQYLCPCVPPSSRTRWDPVGSWNPLHRGRGDWVRMHKCLQQGQAQTSPSTQPLSWETRPALPKSWSQRTQAATCPGWTQDRKYCLILRLDEIIATWKTSGCNK